MKQLKKKSIENKPNLPNITSHLPQLIMHQLTCSQTLTNGSFSPIYSRNYKTNRNNNNINNNKIDDNLESSTLNNFDMNQTNEQILASDLISIGTTNTTTNNNNYMYLINSDFYNDQTFDD